MLEVRRAEGGVDVPSALLKAGVLRSDTKRTCEGVLWSMEALISSSEMEFSLPSCNGDETLGSLIEGVECYLCVTCVPFERSRRLMLKERRMRMSHKKYDRRNEDGSKAWSVSITRKMWEYGVVDMK